MAMPKKIKQTLQLGKDFYNQPCLLLAKALLGKMIVRCQESGVELRARIVETEAYLGGIDKASHSFQGKKTERNTAMFMPPGTLYVYHIYGMYTCLNISSQGDLFLLNTYSEYDDKHTYVWCGKIYELFITLFIYYYYLNYYLIFPKKRNVSFV